MGISKFLMQKEADERGDLLPINLRLHELTIDACDELAGELGTTRSELLREAVEIGLGSMKGEWASAIERGTKNASAKR